jgi:2-succinyl-5-enolpyruvyl-6-hydroxy-3-cyclohexene-1-carboxylate synthase
MNHYLVPNLKIIMINNSGGGIFRFIKGPDTSEYLDEFFEAKHDWKAEKIAEAFGLKYFKATDFEELDKMLDPFYKEDKQTALLEIFTPRELNAKILKDYFKALKT